MANDYELQIMGVIVTSAKINLWFDHIQGIVAMFILAMIGQSAWEDGTMSFITLLGIVGFTFFVFMKALSVMSSRYYLLASRVVYAHMKSGASAQKAFSEIENEHIRNRLERIYNKIIQEED